MLQENNNIKPLITRMNTNMKKWAQEAFAARMGQGKIENLASRLARLLLFSANASLMRSSVPILEIRG